MELCRGSVRLCSYVLYSAVTRIRKFSSVPSANIKLCYNPCWDRLTFSVYAGPSSSQGTVQVVEQWMGPQHVHCGWPAAAWPASLFRFRLLANWIGLPQIIYYSYTQAFYRPSSLSLSLQVAYSSLTRCTVRVLTARMSWCGNSHGAKSCKYCKIPRPSPSLLK